MFLNLILLLTFFAVKAKAENEGLKICLNDLGCLQGSEMSDIEDNKFQAFLGVPYAQPPTGDLRFRNPEPITSWQGVLKANESKADCKQRNYLQPHWPIVGEEDCLYLNIYRPKMAANKKLPVIFYIYGGGFFSGTSNPSIMGPEYFMNTREVIVVVINYRLGPFGFLSSGCSEIPGNFGLKDQRLALQWVNDHIASFGGDPKEITLFGHSSGAASVHFHLLNTKAKDLFKQAILSSGNALAPYVRIVDRPLKQMMDIAQALGIEMADKQTPQQLASKLRTIDADKILKAGDSLKFWHNHILFNFGPVLENASDTNSYLTENPFETISKGNFEKKPWLSGLVSYKGEGAAISLTIYDNLNLRNELNEDFDGKLMKLLDMENKDMFRKLIGTYMQGVHELNPETRDGFFELFSDYYFYYPVFRTLRHYFDYKDGLKGPAYIYKFSYHGPYTYAPFYTAGSKNRYDNVHFDDLVYQFRQTALFPEFEKDSIDAKLSREFVDILVEFVKTGKPLYYDDIGFCKRNDFMGAGPNVWCKYMEFINSDKGYSRVMNNSFQVERMKLWDDLMVY